MNRMQALVLVLFLAGVFGQVFLSQPDVVLPPIVHAAIVAGYITLLAGALATKPFANLGASQALELPQVGGVGTSAPPVNVEQIAQLVFQMSQAAHPAPLVPAVHAPSNVAAAAPAPAVSATPAPAA